jgi:5'(3')-deoxyribonucleotidase
MIKVNDPNRISLGSKKNSQGNIFLDIDGVLANWTEAACKICDIDCDDPETRDLIKKDGRIDPLMDEDEYWSIIEKHGFEWWADIPLFPWAKDLYEELKSMNPNVCFLTSPSDVPDCVKGKMMWINKHFETKDFLIGPAKHFCANKKSLLIDDYPKKVNKFEEYGGTGFLWPEGFSLIDGDIDLEETMEDLFEKVRELG